MRVPKSPKDAGLPHGRWYDQQKTALEWIAGTGKSVLFLDAPTATGKTALLRGLHTMTGTPLYAAMWTKRLQQQTKEMLDVPIIVGRGNFDCQDEPGDTCEFAYCDPYPDLRTACPYRVQLALGQKAGITVLNYGVLLQHIGDKELERRPWLVCDEGHKLEDAMGNWTDVAVHRHWLEELGFPEMLPSHIDKDSLYTWARTAMEVEPPARLGRPLAARWRKAAKLAGKVFGLLARADEVKVYERKFTAYVRVIWPLHRFHQVMGTCDRVLVMSATLGDMDALARAMHLAPEEYDTLSLPSVIPVERRLIYNRPLGNLKMGAPMQEYDVVAGGIAKIILKNFPRERGLIHVSSYQMAGWLGKHLAKADSGLGRRVISELGPHSVSRREWETRLDAPILITPAAGLGLDLPHLFPYQIIAKCPYPDLGDPLVRVRQQLDAGWYVRRTACDLVQIAGRVTRNPSDKGVTIITDSTFQKNVFERAPNMFPQWFKESLR